MDPASVEGALEEEGPDSLEVVDPDDLGSWGAVGRDSSEEVGPDDPGSLEGVDPGQHGPCEVDREDRVVPVAVAYLVHREGPWMIPVPEDLPAHPS